MQYKSAMQMLVVVYGYFRLAQIKANFARLFTTCVFTKLKCTDKSTWKLFCLPSFSTIRVSNTYTCKAEGDFFDGVDVINRWPLLRSKFFVSSATWKRSTTDPVKFFTQLKMILNYPQGE